MSPDLAKFIQDVREILKQLQEHPEVNQETYEYLEFMRDTTDTLETLILEGLPHTTQEVLESRLPKVYPSSKKED